MATGQTSTPRGTRPIDGGGSEAAAVESPSTLISALERGEVDAARLAQVAALIELASALDDVVTVNGAAGPGSIVKVADRLGRNSVYELIARPDPADAREKVTLGSPVGRALLGARPGDYVNVTLANGRRRRVRVIDVTPMPRGPLHAALDHSAAAA